MKIKWLVLLIIVVAAGWYFISPLFNVVEVDDVSPITVVNDDALNHMDEEMKEEFMDQMKEMEDKIMVAEEAVPVSSVLSQGNFFPFAHGVEGKALLIENDDKKILRFEDFETLNGPNLHIYLSASKDDTDFVDLGEIKATKGNVNYELDPNIDTEKYNTVLVWCVPFKVLFSYAELG